MNKKTDQKVRAVVLRRQGLTYSEILKTVHVAKSTLSLWFHDVGLAEHQKQRITEKRIVGQKNAAIARRNQRVKIQDDIWSTAEKEVGELTRRELWLIGVSLYWAEGSKEKEWYPGSGVILSNSDPRMIRVFLAWAKEFSGSLFEKIRFEIYIHESHVENIKAVKEYWSKETRYDISCFEKVYFKKNKIRTKRKNVTPLYNGLLRVRIGGSSTLHRKLEGWARGIDKYIAGSSNGRTPAFEAV
jgi:hypothetical protein